MFSDTTKGLLVLASLVALFAWSAWAGLAAAALIALWIAGLAGRDARQRRAQQRRSRARLEQALAERGLAPGAVFHGDQGGEAIGIDTTGQTIVFASQVESELCDIESILEAHAIRLPQGDFKIGVCVPGRVSGRPYWHDLIVARRRDAQRWVRTLQPRLGAKLKVEGIDAARGG